MKIIFVLLILGLTFIPIVGNILDLIWLLVAIGLIATGTLALLNVREEYQKEKKMETLYSTIGGATMFIGGGVVLLIIFIIFY